MDVYLGRDLNWRSVGLEHDVDGVGVGIDCDILGLVDYLGRSHHGDRYGQRDGIGCCRGGGLPDDDRLDIG